MRRLEFLVSRVRTETDNSDTNGISTTEIVNYFNDAQRNIAAIIFKNNPYADQFKTQVVFAANSTGVYTIPDDCFSTSSISMVEAKWDDSANNGGYSRIKPISESEAAYMFGYYVRNNTVVITGDSPNAHFLSIRITYFSRPKTVDIRQGRVTVVTPGVSITLTPSNNNIALIDDHISMVDAQGLQVVEDIYFSSASGTVISTTETTGVAINQYIVMGKNSTNVSELPEECETYLVDYVKQRIYTRNNYEDANKQMYFTEQQKDEIISIFSKNKKDDDSIPVTDLTYLGF